MKSSTSLAIPRTAALAAALACLTPLASQAGDWRQFRGPLGRDIAGEASLPATLDADTNIAWKIPLPGRGLSSPIIVGDRIYVTAASGPQQKTLHVLCFSAKDGGKLWERRFQATGRTMTHDKTSVAAPTPVSDGRQIFALYSSNDLVCLDLDGNLLWMRGLTLDYPNASNSLGMASSPVVIGDVLVVQVENDSESFAAGIDVRTGMNRWKLDRPKLANWTSPQQMTDPDNGRPVVALQSSTGIDAVDPATGRTVWTFGDGASTIPSSASGKDVLYVPSNGLTALQPDPGSSQPRQLWNSRTLRPGTASPVLWRDLVFVLNAAGVLNCGSAKDGERLWQLRLKGAFSATPVGAGHHLYCVNETGQVQVVDVTAPEGEIVGSLDLGETVLGTPSIAGDALYLRSDGNLWKISQP